MGKKATKELPRCACGEPSTTATFEVGGGKELYQCRPCQQFPNRVHYAPPRADDLLASVTCNRMLKASKESVGYTVNPDKVTCGRCKRFTPNGGG